MKPRHYIVESRAHGYRHWIREGTTRLLTLNEARASATRAESYGCTIGLQARIVDVRTGREVPR